jgi:hypothetical protein
MFKVTRDGDLNFVSKGLRIFSDSYERDFMVVFQASQNFLVLFTMRDKTIFCSQYCALELYIDFLRDFFVSFNIGDFYFEISNVAHHEE